MKILLVDNETKHVEELTKLIPGIEDVRSWYELNGNEAEIYDLIVLSGSSDASVVWHNSFFEKEIELIKNARVPIIGICFGSELIAFSFGASFKELENEHHGIRNITLSEKIDIGTNTIQVYEHHRWIISTMSDTLIVLGSSEDGPELIKHKSLPLYGLQFHPEHLCNETDGKKIFEYILKEISLK